MSPPTGRGPIRVTGLELGRRPARMTAVRALVATAMPRQPSTRPATAPQPGLSSPTRWSGTTAATRKPVGTSTTTEASTRPKAHALGMQAVTDVADHGRLPVQARLTGRSDPVVYPCAAREVAMATQVMTVTDARTTDRARGRVMALLTVMAPRLATAHRAGRPELTARTSVAGRLDQTACRPLLVALVREGP